LQSWFDFYVIYVIVKMDKKGDMVMTTLVESRQQTALKLKDSFDYINKFCPPVGDINWERGTEVALNCLRHLTVADIPPLGVGGNDHDEAVASLLYFQGLRSNQVRHGRGKIIAFAELLRRSAR